MRLSPGIILKNTLSHKKEVLHDKNHLHPVLHLFHGSARGRKNLKTVITAKTEDYVPEKSPKELIEDALEHPIGTPKLSELAKGKNKVVLVTSDHTRAVPSRLTLPILLKKSAKEILMQTSSS